MTEDPNFKGIQAYYIMLDVRCLCLYIIDDELRRLVLETSVFRPKVIWKAVKIIFGLEIIASI